MFESADLSDFDIEICAQISFLALTLEANWQMGAEYSIYEDHWDRFVKKIHFCVRLSVPSIGGEKKNSEPKFYNILPN